ncbi:hypothetical protein LTR95_008836 [Oleoguttula sp. CCFEE 5521]
MASTILMREVQDARDLAHKIWLECHNGRSQYHCLAVDVRSMRNVLEDIEEASSSQDTMSAEHATKLQDGVTSCSSALCILELSLFALQRSRHSFNVSKGSGVLRSLKPFAVATLRKTLFSSTAEAILALKALSAVVMLPLEAADSTLSCALAGRSATVDHVADNEFLVQGDSSDDSSHTIETQSLANVDTLKATADSPSAQPSASYPPRLTISPTSTGTVEKAAADPETTASQAIIKGSQPDAVVLTLGLRSPAVITASSSASKQVIVTLADILSTKDGLSCIPGKKSSSSSASQIENDETGKHQITHDKVPPVLHMDPTRFLSDLGAQESVRMPASCVFSPEVALTAAQPDNIQAASAEIPVAPLSRLVQRLKSNARAPTPAAQRSSGIHEISLASASCQAQPELTTVCLDSAATCSPSLHTTSLEDLYSSSRPTTPRPSAESICRDRQIPRGNDHRSSLMQPGLEVDERSAAERTLSQLSFRNSEEEVLMIRASPDCTIGRDGPVSTPTSATSPTYLLSQPTRRPPPPPPIPARPDVASSLAEKDKSLFDAVDALRTSSPENVLVDNVEDRLSRICRCWNNQLWPHAEAYLVEQLGSCSGPSDREAVRRIKHLLGVCASFQDHWQRALVLFVSVLNPGSEEVSDLDSADCAALWWLADTYTPSGRGAEAFLAYCMALQGYALSGSAPHAVVQYLRFEQQCINISRTDFRSQWDAKTGVNRKTSATDTIFNTWIFSQALVKASFDAMALDITQPKPGTGANRSRVNMLHQYDGYKAGSGYATEYRSFQHIALTESMYEADGAWPPKYDPTFCIANVARGRLIERPCDLLEYISTNPGLDFARARAGVWAISRRTRFKCDELQWLVGAVRACLDVMNIEWTEPADSDTTGLCFTARHSLLSRKIATMDFFTVSLFRHSLHSKYSVAVCTDGIRSARISARAKQPETAVTLSKKRLEKFVYTYLKQAYAQRAATDASVLSPTHVDEHIDEAGDQQPRKSATAVDAVIEVLEKSTFLATSESFKDKTTMLVIQPIGPSADMQKRTVEVSPVIKKSSRVVSANATI